MTFNIILLLYPINYTSHLPHKSQIAALFIFPLKNNFPPPFSFSQLHLQMMPNNQGINLYPHFL